MEKMKTNFSEELTRFIKTVAAEAAADNADGILGKLVQITGGERDVYEFVTSEGYQIAYDEFLDYYKACQLGISSVNAELSDDALDQVAGGWGISSITHYAKKAANTAVSAATDTTKYVANNPGAFIAASGAIGTGVGTALGAVTGGGAGGALGAALGAGAGLAPGLTVGGGLGAAIGGGIGGATGTVIGAGAVIIANELT